MFLSIIVLLALQISLSFCQLPPGCARTYKVAPGDVCDIISAKNNVSTYQLTHVNPLINKGCSNLFAGQTLCLGITGQDCTSITVVKAGDGCVPISEAADIGLAIFLGNNPNIDISCTNIYPGEVLCTSPLAIPYK